MTVFRTKVGQRSISEIEQLIKNEQLDLTFHTDDDGLDVEITWYAQRASVLVLCHNREAYCQSYASLQELRDAQPWELSRFDIVERIRDDELG
jgi:hypothetical protein